MSSCGWKKEKWTCNIISYHEFKYGTKEQINLKGELINERIQITKYLKLGKLYFTHNFNIKIRQ